jgi:hypothetical protein
MKTAPQRLRCLLFALDTERCGSLTQAVMEEIGGDPIIFGVRLQWMNGRIREIESYIARKTEFMQTPKGVPEADGDTWESILKPEERSTRAQMEAAANSYFDMFFDPKTVKPPFATPCNRWENGFRTTRGDCSNMGPAGRGGMQMTRRRFPLSDIEAGITAGFVMFGGRLLDFHMFKIRSGAITQIQAIVGPASAASGWEETEKR